MAKEFSRSPREIEYLQNAPDEDLTKANLKALLKASRPQNKVERKRTTGNIFTTLSGKTQPRQGG